MRGLVLLLLAGLTLASGLKVPAEVESQDGGFLSLPVALPGAGERLEVVAPPGFRLVSRPRARAGRQLLNFYIERGLASGHYLVRLRLWRDGRVWFRGKTTVFVRPRVAFAVRGPPGGPIVLGETAEYVVEIANTGNVPDTYRVVVESAPPGVLVDPKRVHLAPGRRAAVRVSYHPTRAGPFVVILAVRSQRDPQGVRRLGWSTDVLPFAGAERLGRRSLRYLLEFEAGPSSQGWRWGAEAGLGGGLSDYVQGHLSGRFGATNPGVRLEASGDWGWLRGMAAPGAWGLALGQRDWNMGLDFTDRVWGARIGWRPDPWKFSLSASAGRQRLTAGVRFPVGAQAWFEPEVRLERVGKPGALVWGVRLAAGYGDAGWLGRAQVHYLGGLLGGSVQLATRRSQPFGLRGFGYLQAGEFSGQLSGHRDLLGAWGLDGRVSYSKGHLDWSLETRYVNEKTPWFGGMGLVGRDLAPGLRARLGYRSEGARLGGWLGWRSSAGWIYGLSAQLSHEGLNLGVSYQSDPLPRLGFSLSHTWRGWRVRGDYLHDLRNDQGEGAAEIDYTAARWGLSFGVRGDVQRVQAWALLKLRWEGGFPTPEPVVELFGGRRSGLLVGRVFLDENQNGRPDPGEPALAGARISCGAAGTESDARGRFRLEVRPGRCRVEASARGGRLGLLKPEELAFQARSRVERDLGLVPVARLSGEAWADANRNGARDPDERLLPGVWVVARGPSGVLRVLTDAYGRFAFPDLLPGRYQVQLAPEGLPHLFQPAKPLLLEIKPGPLPFVAVAAVPVERRAVQTFRIGDVALFVDLSPSSVPPGAEVEVRARVEGGEPEAVVLEAGDEARPMVPLGSGRWKGILSVPIEAKGLRRFQVRARFSHGEVVQEGFVLVRPGPLATLRFQPALADPGGRVTVVAHLLKFVKSAQLHVEGRVLPMERLDRWHWRAVLAAPMAPGRYRVELWAEGRRWAEGGFRVLEK